MNFDDMTAHELRLELLSCFYNDGEETKGIRDEIARREGIFSWNSWSIEPYKDPFVPHEGTILEGTVRVFGIRTVAGVTEYLATDGHVYRSLRRGSGQVIRLNDPDVPTAIDRAEEAFRNALRGTASWAKAYASVSRAKALDAEDVIDTLTWNEAFLLIDEGWRPEGWTDPDLDS